MSHEKNKPGRPPQMTVEAQIHLEKFLLLGASVTQACALVGVSRSTYYRFKEENPAWAKRIEAAKNTLRLQAELVLRDAIVDDKSLSAAQWYLRHRHSDAYNTKGDLVDDTAKPEKPLHDLLQAIEDERKESGK